MEKILKSYNHVLSDEKASALESHVLSKNIVLASASPRRRELLLAMGLQFEVCKTDIDESKTFALSPFALVKALSKAKANAASQMIDCHDKTIIAADTIVFRHRVYGKPKDIVDALDMLMKLAGKWHSVYTGVTVMTCDQTVSFVVRSRVKIKELQRQQIEKYIYECNPLDKAGSYGIQDNQIVEKFRGSFSNIVGLPIEKLEEVLQKQG